MLSVCSTASGQVSTDTISVSKKYNPTKTYVALGSSTFITTAFSIGLYQTWYAKYPQSQFHFFNDWNEWENVDKAGHSFTAYIQAENSFKVAQWAGLEKRSSIITGVVAGTVFQGIVETLDGFSTKWGFSTYDLAFNTIGVGVFALQQHFWNEQRIRFKVSSWYRTYDDGLFESIEGGLFTSNLARANGLYGSSFLERFLKDYNAQTIWLSMNISRFFEHRYIPKWLNIALGYGANNLYGGFENRWLFNGQNFSRQTLPRVQQYYLALDIDFSTFNGKNAWINSSLSFLNIFKWPMPALEYTSEKEWRFHLLFTH